MGDWEGFNFKEKSFIFYEYIFLGPRKLRTIYTIYWKRILQFLSKNFYFVFPILKPIKYSDLVFTVMCTIKRLLFNKLTYQVTESPEMTSSISSKTFDWIWQTMHMANVEGKKMIVLLIGFATVVLRFENKTLCGSKKIINFSHLRLVIRSILCREWFHVLHWNFPAIPFHRNTPPFVRITFLRLLIGFSVPSIEKAGCCVI